MENVNKIELQGIIGSSRITSFGNKEVLRLTVATNIIYKGGDGMAVVDTTWHNVSYFKKPEDNMDFSTFVKGSGVKVSGRLKMNRYTTSDGCERYSYEVVANTMELIKE